VELDLLAKAEMIDIVVEILKHLRVMGEIRELVGDGEVLELHAVLRRVNMERLVAGRHTVLVLVGPVTANRVRHFENIEQNPAILKGLGGGKSAAPCPDDASLWQSTGGRLCLH